MTPEERDHLKRVLRRVQQEIQELWMEKQLLRNLIIDSGWMSEQRLDSAIEQGRGHQHNIQKANENVAASEHALAEFGLAE